MANRLQQTIALQTKISPQQIQMIKLLELPAMQLEERIKREIEENIVLEEEPDTQANDNDEPTKISVEEYIGREDDTPSYKARINNFSKDDKQRTVCTSVDIVKRKIFDAVTRFLLMIVSIPTLSARLI